MGFQLFCTRKPVDPGNSFERTRSAPWPGDGRPWAGPVGHFFEPTMRPAGWASPPGRRLTGNRARSIPGLRHAAGWTCLRGNIFLYQGEELGIAARPTLVFRGSEGPGGRSRRKLAIDAGDATGAPHGPCPWQSFGVHAGFFRRQQPWLPVSPEALCTRPWTAREHGTPVLKLCGSRGRLMWLRTGRSAGAAHRRSLVRFIDGAGGTLWCSGGRGFRAGNRLLLHIQLGN